MNTIFHALVLNLHQPAGNLEDLLENDEWKAKEILLALDRIPRSLWGYEDLARVHLALSGTLLETLRSPGFQQRVYGVVKCGDFLWHLQNLALFRLLGTGYYHPVLPLIPQGDWDEHIARWLSQARPLFARDVFPGFWPPEMGFCMELIPHLCRAGYRYAMVDSEHVEPLSSMRWEEVRYRPHLARYGGSEIVVVVRDRDLSNVQEAGTDPDWLVREIQQRTQYCDFPPLVTTCTDGDNGGWFRNVSGTSNFWGACYVPLLERARRGVTQIRPTFIEDYLDRFGTQGEVRIRTGAWNTGWHHGRDFMQWIGSSAQRDALQRVADTSRALLNLRPDPARANAGSQDWNYQVEQARWHLLRAETSCNLFWGEAWVGRCHEDLDQAWHWLNRLAG